MVHNEDIDRPQLEELCDKVTRQTGYDREVAREKLLEFDMDLTAVIRDYLKPPPKPQLPEKSLNQRIYQEIRSFMDVAPQKFPVKSIQ
jgi:hypothetical protein